jgi:competence protein ComEC
MSAAKILKEPLFWLSLFLILLCWALFSLPDGRLHVIFCDVGQGDATLIVYRRTQILVDGGPDQKVLQCLDQNLPFYDRRLEMVVLTHSEDDHQTGLIDVLERYDVRYFVSNGLNNSSATFSELEKTKKGKKVLPVLIKTGDQIKIGSLHFSVLWPPKGYPQTKELNDSSVVLNLSFRSFDVLLPGDISEKIEKSLDATKAEVLKVAHHGSRFSTSQAFLEMIQPKLAVICVGQNHFGHPTQEVLNRLKEAGVKILRTDKTGEIEIVSDGWRWYNRLNDNS